MVLSACARPHQTDIHLWITIENANSFRTEVRRRLSCASFPARNRHSATKLVASIFFSGKKYAEVDIDIRCQGAATTAAPSLRNHKRVNVEMANDPNYELRYLYTFYTHLGSIQVRKIGAEREANEGGSEKL